jgi:GDP-L-fucose synthase
MAMGLHLIDEARRHRLDKFVQIGTVCSYPKFAPVPFREEDLWSGYPDEATAPYGIAKRSILTMLQAYREQYGLNGIYLIPVNLYGPRADFNPATSHVVAALIDRFLEAKAQDDGEVVVWGTGSVSREFLYVEDAASAIVAATGKYNGDQAVNIGTGTAVTIRELAETIAELTGYQGTVVWDSSKPDGQPRRQVDTSRAARLFEFDATTPLRDGLLHTIEWWGHQRSQR